MKTYEETLAELLARVPDNLDKTEGSPVYIALAPVAAILAEQNVYSANIFDSTMPDTAGGDELTRICKGFGVNRYPAAAAVRKAIFTNADESPANVPIGSRFGADGLAYVVTQKISDGVYRLACERAGIIGNSYFGAILPLDEGVSLGSATLADVLEPGEDEESDMELRDRFYRSVNTRVTNGNAAWYAEEISGIGGVSGVKIFPTPDGQGGRVHCVITAPGDVAASAELIRKVRDTINERAPIDHYITVSTVSELPVDICGKLWLRSGYDIQTVMENIQTAVTAYLKSLSFTDAVVRIALIEAAIVSSGGVADVADIRINGGVENISLPAAWDDYMIPKLGELQLVPEG